jgi:indolepyruvate ferredoxin oxidoreductase alpha subunit
MRGNTVLGKISEEKRIARFDLEKFSLSRLMQKGALPSPFWNPVIDKNLHRKEQMTKEEFEKFDGNKLEFSEANEFGIIASGMAYNYVAEGVEKLGLYGKVAILKLATPYPLPERRVSAFLGAVEKLVVMEELEPFVEIQVRALAQEVNPSLKIYGKISGHVPREGELNTEVVANALARILGIVEPYKATPKINLFQRMLTMCAGCSHRATGYALKQAITKVARGSETVVDNDIGCYLLLMGPPFLLNDMSFCMGASVSVPQGRYHAGTDQIHVGIVGDSTFLHAGIPGLINAVHNKAKAKFVILENKVTAMTGFQPHAGTGVNATGEKAKAIDIEEIVKACAVDFVKVVDPYNYEETFEVLREMLQFDGTAVVISRRMCANEALRRMRREGKRPATYHVDQERCAGCGLCSRQFGCPAIGWNERGKKAEIVSHLCTGCSVCAQICPAKAIVKGKSQ